MFASTTCVQATRAIPTCSLQPHPPIQPRIPPTLIPFSTSADPMYPPTAQLASVPRGLRSPMSIPYNPSSATPTPTPDTLEEVNRILCRLRALPRVTDILSLCDHAGLSTNGSLDALIDRYWRSMVRRRFPEVPVEWDPTTDERGPEGALTLAVVEKEKSKGTPSLPPSPTPVKITVPPTLDNSFPIPRSSSEPPSPTLNTTPTPAKAAQAPAQDLHLETDDPEVSPGSVELPPLPQRPYPYPIITDPVIPPTPLHAPLAPPPLIARSLPEPPSPINISTAEPRTVRRKNPLDHFEKSTSKVIGKSIEEGGRLLAKLVRISQLHKAKQLKRAALKRNSSHCRVVDENPSPNVPLPSSSPQLKDAAVQYIPPENDSLSPLSSLSSQRLPMSSGTSRCSDDKSTQTEPFPQPSNPSPKRKLVRKGSNSSSSSEFAERNPRSPESGYRSSTSPPPRLPISPRNSNSQPFSPTSHIPPLMARLVPCPAPCPEVPALRKFLYPSVFPQRVPTRNSFESLNKSRDRRLRRNPPIFRDYSKHFPELLIPQSPFRHPYPSTPTSRNPRTHPRTPQYPRNYPRYPDYPRNAPTSPSSSSQSSESPRSYPRSKSSQNSHSSSTESSDNSQ